MSRHQTARHEHEAEDGNEEEAERRRKPRKEKRRTRRGTTRAERSEKETPSTTRGRVGRPGGRRGGPGNHRHTHAHPHQTTPGRGALGDFPAMLARFVLQASLPNWARNTIHARRCSTQMRPNELLEDFLHNAMYQSDATAKTHTHTQEQRVQDVDARSDANPEELRTDADVKPRALGAGRL